MRNVPRTDTARDHDDTDLIEGMIPAGNAATRSADGHVAQDVGNAYDLTRQSMIQSRRGG